MTTRIAGEGIVLREWTEADLPAMVRLFDDPEIAYRTPLASPFDRAAAETYLDAVQRAREGNTRLHLAITEDGGEPLGEVLISIASRAIGYGVGAAHRGQGLAARATRLLTAYAHTTLGLPYVILEIDPDNTASVAVATAAGFRRTDTAPVPVENKGRVYTLATWSHEAPLTAPRVRHARPEDLPRVAELAAEHAAYEKAAPPSPGLPDRLDALLFTTPTPRLRCLVAELPDGTLAGYATCAPEISTWEGEYLHMDCLYLSAAHRGLGLGPLLMTAVESEARTLGLKEIQWQTPSWNEGAIRFYARLGAEPKEKLRYTLRVG
ncbi:hypothetical protein GCM10014713_36120 [Streptomyces purpureus]|uniref:N-acetyltransferase domain-containing protein n=1 Tax=Streptomyces purpureus TaxID=1951 RepID=A0A918LRC8_9ACTN|nr:hypothetical protein GCM10014713_36120 [Streptomyces purpureus]